MNLPLSRITLFELRQGMVSVIAAFYSHSWFFLIELDSFLLHSSIILVWDDFL